MQFSFQTIFYILPRLSGLVEDEWIAIGKFTSFTDIPLDAGFQWYLSSTQLCDLEPGDWAQQDRGKENRSGSLVDSVRLIDLSYLGQVVDFSLTW